MTRVGLAVTVGLLASLASGCIGGGHGAERLPPPVTTLTVPADKPPSPDTWPAYPNFSAHSCWTRRFGNGIMRAAPSIPPRRTERGTPPAEIVHGLLNRFGDRRYIERITIGRPPPVTLRHLHGYFGGRRPPADAAWAYIRAPATRERLGTHPSPEQVGVTMVAKWETELVIGALRDDFCAAGGRPLVGASTNNLVSGLSDNTFALLQHFPNPAVDSFPRRVELIGRRYGFRVVSVRLLHPRQIAPLLVVETSRDRKMFVRDVPAISSLLDPLTSGSGQGALTFEGLFLEARDAQGPFVRVENVNRGEAEGGQWSWDPCVYPFLHSQPSALKCP